MQEIEPLLEQIINSLKQLTEQEKFPLYAELYSQYSSALTQFERTNSISELKGNIRWTTRMLMEAPPNNGELGLKILEEITVLYKAMDVV